MDGALSNNPLIGFAICIGLFHFANAPLLPLVGQKIKVARKDWASAAMSTFIVAAQLVMLPNALLSGREAGRWGRRPILRASFAILPVRAALYTLSANPAWLIFIRLMDGIGSGVLSVLTPLFVEDLMRGAGRYNLALGTATTAQGLDASLSGLATGVVVDHSGFGAALLECGLAAVIALGTLWVYAPESAPRGSGRPRRGREREQGGE